METITIPGFARIDEDGIFHYAPYGVYAPDYTLLLADKDTYTYPTEGVGIGTTQKQTLELL